jgi:transposase
LSEQHKYRQFTPEQKAEIVLAGLRGDRSVRDVCREYQLAETLYYQWRERLVEGGKAALANPRDKTPEQAALEDLRRKVGQLERALGRKTYEPGGRGGTVAGLGVSQRVARSRAVIAAGYRPAVVARIAGVSRQALYRRPGRRLPRPAQVPAAQTIG